MKAAKHRLQSPPHHIAVTPENSPRDKIVLIWQFKNRDKTIAIRLPIITIRDSDSIDIQNKKFENILKSLNAPFGFTHNDLTLHPRIKK